jgi:hypothetical protein
MSSGKISTAQNTWTKLFVGKAAAISSLAGARIACRKRTCTLQLLNIGASTVFYPTFHVKPAV